MAYVQAVGLVERAEQVNDINFYGEGCARGKYPPREQYDALKQMYVQYRMWQTERAKCAALPAAQRAGCEQNTRLEFERRCAGPLTHLQSLCSKLPTDQPPEDIRWERGCAPGSKLPPDELPLVNQIIALEQRLEAEIAFCMQALGPYGPTCRAAVEQQLRPRIDAKYAELAALCASKAPAPAVLPPDEIETLPDEADLAPTAPANEPAAPASRASGAGHGGLWLLLGAAAAGLVIWNLALKKGARA